MLGIRDILVRIWIRGSVPLTNFIVQALFRSAQHLYEKRERSGSGSIPLTNGSRPGRPKNMRILRIRIPDTGRYDTCDRIELDVGGSRHLRPVARPKRRGGSSTEAGACRKTTGLAQTVRSDDMAPF